MLPLTMAGEKKTKPRRQRPQKKTDKEENSSLEELQEVQPKTRKPKTKPTLESHLKRYDDIIEFVKTEIDRKKTNSEPGVRPLQRIGKELKSMRSEVPRISKKRGYRKNSDNRVSGFTLECEISGELRKFLGLKPKDKVTRRDVTNALCVYVHLKDNEKREGMLRWAHLNKDDRDLRDETNKMHIVPDKNLAKLLNYNQYKKDVKSGKITSTSTNKETGEVTENVVSDDGLYYRTMQQLIQVHIPKTKLAFSE